MPHHPQNPAVLQDLSEVPQAMAGQWPRSHHPLLHPAIPKAKHPPVLAQHARERAVPVKAMAPLTTTMAPVKAMAPLTTTMAPVKAMAPLATTMAQMLQALQEPQVLQALQEPQVLQALQELQGLRALQEPQVLPPHLQERPVKTALIPAPELPPASSFCLQRAETSADVKSWADRCPKSVIPEPLAQLPHAQVLPELLPVLLAQVPVLLAPPKPVPPALSPDSSPPVRPLLPVVLASEASSPTNHDLPPDAATSSLLPMSPYSRCSECCQPCLVKP